MHQRTVPMARKPGRPKGAGNRYNRAADHRDRIALARVLREEPALPLVQAVYRVLGGVPPRRSHDPRVRRLLRTYPRLAGYYADLVRLPEPAQSLRPATDIWPMLTLQAEYDRLVRDFMAGQAEHDRLIRDFMARQAEHQRLIRLVADTAATPLTLHPSKRRS
jgi:hypothetical protein